MRSALLISSLFFATQTQAADLSVIDLYGDRLEFNVLRDGSVIGEHITRFSQEDNNLLVMSRTKLEVSILFVPVYSFDYKSKEIWSGKELHSLNVSVSDNGKPKNFRASREDNILKVENDGMNYAIEGPAYTTNHWASNVVTQDKVINTLTGNINNVLIEAKGKETIKTASGNLEAIRYNYTGDLQDTSVWYDEFGRWVKLQFQAEDGSIITYECKNCGPIKQAAIR